MREEVNDHHNVIDAECAACLRRWTAVAPVGAGVGSLECPSCGERRSRVYVPRNLTAREHATLAAQLVGKVWAALPKDYEHEATLAQALAQLAAVRGEVTEGPFGPYVAEGHL